MATSKINKTWVIGDNFLASDQETLNKGTINSIIDDTDDNTTAIGNNAMEIGIVEGRVSNHDTDISTNESAISDIEDVLSGVNVAQIEINRLDIATNVGAISRNIDDIIDNTTDIATNTSAIHDLETNFNFWEEDGFPGDIKAVGQGVSVPSLKITALPTGTIDKMIGIDSTGLVIEATAGSTSWDYADTSNVKVINNNSTIQGGDYNTALGHTSQIIGAYSLAGGNNSIIIGNYGFCHGDTNKVYSLAGTSIGSHNQTDGSYGLSIGYNNYASGSTSFAGGFRVEAQGSSAFNFSQGEDLGYTTNFGTSCAILGGFNNNIGSALSSASKNSAIICGEENSIAQNTENSAVIGGDYNEIGYGNINSVIIGGSNNTINADNCVVLGYGGITATQNNTTYVKYLNIGSVDAGTIEYNLGVDSTGKVIQGSTGGGDTSEFFSGGTGTNAIQSKWNTETCAGDYSFAAGLDNDVEGDYSIGLGQGNDIEGTNSVGLGYSNDVPGSRAFSVGYGNHSNDWYSITMGSACISSADYGIAMGQAAMATANNAVSIGKFSEANGVGSYALGYASTTNKVEANAIYSGIFAGYDNKISSTALRSVVLGGSDINAVTPDTLYTPKIELTETGGTIIMKSPDGTKYKLSIANGGTISVTAV